MEYNYQSGMPPRFEQVLTYFLQKGIPADEARDFFLFYNSRGWISSRGNVYRSWKNIAHYWIVGVLAAYPWLRDRKRN